MNRLKYGDELCGSVEAYQHLRSRVFLIQYHLVWCPKGRKPVLVGKVGERLEQIIRQVVDEFGI
jgi:putative transposase